MTLRLIFIIMEKDAIDGIRMPVMSFKTYKEAEKHQQYLRAENPGNVYYLYQVPYQG